MMACESPIRGELDDSIAFQRRWRRLTSIFYFLGASMSILSTIVATVVAGLGLSDVAAVAAGIATAFTSLEKVLLFREKWTHHRKVEVQLNMIRLDALAGVLDEKQLSQKLKEILVHYDSSMPASTT